MKRILLPMLCLLVAGCDRSGSEESENAVKPVAQVRTAVAVGGSAAETVTAYGVAEQAPGNEHGLTTQAEARVERIVAPTGTAVGAGQVVAVLAPTANARLDVAKAVTDARSTEEALARALRLRKDGLASDADVNSARAAYQSAAQTYAAARQRGATLVLRAPISGTVQGMTAKPGDIVPAGATVASIGSRGDLRAHLGVDPAIATRVRTGQPISISAINAASGATTTVIGVDPLVDPATHLASIFARLPVALAFGPGQPIRAAIAVNGGGSGVLIPYSALLDDGGRAYVFVVRNGVASQRDVKPGNSVGDMIQIVQGLQAGERVVVEGGTALQDGMKVQEQRPAAAGQPH